MDCDLECSSKGDEAVRAPMNNHDKEIIIAGLVGLDLPPEGYADMGTCRHRGGGVKDPSGNRTSK